MEQTSSSRATKTQTTQKKRKHSEYHDPDYHTVQPEKQATSENGKKLTNLEHCFGDPADKAERYAKIVRREFQKEILAKEQQLAEIDARLLQARHILDKLRYDVVSDYYRKQEVSLTQADILKIRGSDTWFGDERDGAQIPLHPAIKKIVGKRPVPIQTHLPERTAAALAKQTIRLRNPAHRRAERRRQQTIREQGIVIDHSKEIEVASKNHCIKTETDDDKPCTSRHALERQKRLDVTGLTETNSSALNASRLNNKNKFSFVVGNTSKYIGEVLSPHVKGAKSQTLDYKWLVYVQGKNLPQPLDMYIKKVRFQLHHTYRPNDIVDVHAPPFQISRRGWGEFPMRIQLFFQENLQQKPVQLMHTVVLDKSMCGLHTMGAETTVEVWLRIDTTISNLSTATTILTKNEPLTPPQNTSKPRTISITQNKEDLDDNLFGFICKNEMSGDIEKIEPTVLVSEPLTCSLKLYSPIKKSPTPTKPQLRMNATCVSASRPSIVYLPVNGRARNSSQTPFRITDKLKRFGESEVKNEKNGLSKKPPPKNVVFQKEGKLYIIDPLQSKLKQAQKQQQSLLKPQLSLLKPPTSQQLSSNHLQILQAIHNDHGYANMSGTSSYNDATPQQFGNDYSSVPIHLSQRLQLEQIFNGIRFQSMRSALDFLMRHLPITASNSSEFPFVCASPAAFQAESALRQRCYEYLRARSILRCMRQHLSLQHLNASGQEQYWSLREIVYYARVHGYTPPLKAIFQETINKQDIESTGEQLAHLVQQEFKTELPKHLGYSSVTSNACVSNWLTQATKRYQLHEQHMGEQEFIDVVVEETKESQRGRQLTTMPRQCQLLYLPPPEKLDAAVQLVHDMCKDVAITLKPEQSVLGVSQPLALTLLAHVLQLFVEKLVRRAAATKLSHRSPNDQKSILPLAAPNPELIIQPYDIGRVITQCIDFDFLGNSSLGLPSITSQT